MMTETVADRRLHPGTVPLRFLKNAPSTVLGLPAFLGFATDIGIWRVVAGALAIALVSLVGGWIAWARFRYGVGPGGIVIESGILNRSRRSIPFERIQDVDIERGPLARLFGLAKLRIETGGADKDEGTLDSVTLAEAERLQAALKTRHAVMADAATATDEPVIFAMDVPRVALAGLFNFSMVWLAGIFAAAQTLGDLLPFTLDDWAAMTGLSDGRAAERFTPGAIAAALVLALLLGTISGLVATMLREFGFTLALVAQGFRRRRGLLTKSEVTIPRRRIQLGLLKSGPISRRLGWWALSVQTMGAQEAEGGKQPVAPFARMNEVERVLAEARPLRLPAASAMTRVSRNYVWKAAITRAPLALLIGGAAVVTPFAWPLLPVVALLLLGAILERRAHRYALDRDLLFVERGFVTRRVWLAPAASAQTVSVSRSWLQRRLGTATLLVDTAGASLLSDPRIVDLREAVARDLAAEVVARI